MHAGSRARRQFLPPFDGVGLSHRGPTRCLPRGTQASHVTLSRHSHPVKRPASPSRLRLELVAVVLQCRSEPPTSSTLPVPRSARTRVTAPAPDADHTPPARPSRAREAARAAFRRAFVGFATQHTPNHRPSRPQVVQFTATRTEHEAPCRVPLRQRRGRRGRPLRAHRTIIRRGRECADPAASEGGRRIHLARPDRRHEQFVQHRKVLHGHPRGGLQPR